ncbi:hypothetical protein [Azospirillum brasilense]|uniref:hypothetical protein n=1 Tax=Azospirillum brasilense TaxID=192 RepID=UPI0011788FD9|nr:hypothetical protein [Azospirillum brasilense]
MSASATASNGLFGLRNAAGHNEARGTSRAKEKEHRLHLALSPRSMELLDALKDKTEASSYAEVFKNAMRLYAAIIEETDKGNDLYLKDQDGNLTQYKVFF